MARPPFLGRIRDRIHAGREDELACGRTPPGDGAEGTHQASVPAIPPHREIRESEQVEGRSQLAERFEPRVTPRHVLEHVVVDVQLPRHPPRPGNPGAGQPLGEPPLPEVTAVVHAEVGIDLTDHVRLNAFPVLVE